MIKKLTFGLLTILILLTAVFFFWVNYSYDKTYDLGYPNLSSTTDSTTIARGAYLVNGPAHCTGCHVSTIEELIQIETGSSLPMKGGIPFPIGALGTIYPANLTPDSETGIGRYEEKEIFRMMRHAVKPNGRATLTPLMPFNQMADDDLVAVVSYLKSLEPVLNQVPEPEWSFLGKFVRSVSPVFRPIEEPNAPRYAPSSGVSIERGKYLAQSVANCAGCHTPRDQQSFEAIGPEFSGGMEFEPWPDLNRALDVDENLWTRSTNITPHPNSSFSRYKSVQQWIRRFKQGRLIPQSPMPWGSFANISDDDLESIYIYLKSLQPVENDIKEVVYKRSS